MGEFSPVLEEGAIMSGGAEKTIGCINQVHLGTGSLTSKK